jgi:hypothetical protein
MISGIKKWFRDRRLKKRRSLFRYWNGEKHVYADPFKVWRAILNHPKFNVETMAYLVDEGAEPETTVCVEAMCEIFNVSRWNSENTTGLTDMEIIAMLDSFDLYLGSVKKNSSLGVTSSVHTELESSSSKEAPPQTTNCSLDATSTCTEPSCAEE